MPDVNLNRVEIGDCRTILSTLPDGVFQTCVTSPPYFGLRDYGQDAQIGLESTPEAYVAELVAVFREVRRTLRDDGTLWLNLGDSYAGSWGNQGRRDERGSQRPINGPMLSPVHDGRYPDRGSNTGAVPDGLKAKDLIGIPWRVAFALQADGWYLRSDIIWSKPNPMPESVTDRPTKAHEYLFLLSKSQRYYYDAKAIAEPSIHAGAVVTNDNGKNGQMGEFGRNRGGFLKEGGVTVAADRNRRTVWTVATQPYRGAHFAVMPEALVEPCVLAGSPEGGAVLDPFMGSGTVGRVAERLGRRWFGCELNPAYGDLIGQRTAQVGIIFEEAKPDA